MHCRHFRWRNINNKIIMSRFWPNSKPNIFVTRKFLIHIHREWIPAIAPGLVNGAHFPCPISWDWTECWYYHWLFLRSKSVASIVYLLIHIWHSHKSSYFQQTFCLNLDKHQKMPQEMQSYMFRSVVTVLCVSRIMSQLWTIQDFKGEYLGSSSLRRNFLYCLIATLWLYDGL